MRNNFIDHIVKKVMKNKKIYLICSDLGGCQFPSCERLLMEGISESHIVNMAAGIASEGNMVYLVSHASFITKRSYEQLFLNIGLQNANVRIVGVGAGSIYYNLGLTHLSLNDICLIRTMPNFIMALPSDSKSIISLDNLLNEYAGPVYYRVNECMTDIKSPEIEIYGRPTLHKEKDQKCMLIYNGAMKKYAYDVSKKLEEFNIASNMMYLHSITNETKEYIYKYLEKYKIVVVFEDHMDFGGVADYVFGCFDERYLKEKHFLRFSYEKLPKDVGFSEKDMFRLNIGTKSDLVNKIKEFDKRV